jgi:large conductance mechanosensitive channel
MKGFRDFLLRASLVDLAIAVVVGVAFGGLINSLVADLVTPLIAAIGGRPDFSNLAFTVHHSTFKYGDFVNSVLAFAVVAATVYFFVMLPVNKLLEHRRDVTRECLECLSRIPYEARRCMNCASPVTTTEHQTEKSESHQTGKINGVKTPDGEHAGS